MTLLISYICFLVFPVVIGGVLYSRVEKAMVDQANRSNLAMLEQLRLSMDSSVKEVDQLSQQIALNPKMDLLLNNDLADESSYKYIEFISDYLNRYRSFSGQFIEDYYVFFKGSDTILKPGVRTDSRTFYNSYYSYKDMNYESWRKEVLESNHNRDYLPSQTLIQDGGLPLTASLERQPIQVITYVQSLIPIQGTSDVKGSLVVLINEKQVKEMIRQIESANRSNIYIIDANQKVLTGTTDQVPLSKQVFGQMQDKPGFFPYKKNGLDLMVSYTSSKQIGWKYISVMPRDLYMQKVNSVKVTAIWLFAVYLAGGLVASYLMAYHNYRPVKQMLKAFVKGRTAAHSHISNEYEYIQESFESVLIEQKNLQGMLKQQTPVMRANFLSRLIRGLVDHTEDFSHSLDFMNIQFVSGSFAVILIQVDQAGKFSKEHSERQWALTRFVISNICTDLIHEHHAGYCIELDRDRLVILLNFKENRLNEAMQDTEKLVSTLKEVVEHQFKIAITLAVSNVHEGWQRIGSAYVEALAAMEYKMIKGSAIIYFHEINCKDQNYYYPMETEIQLMNYVRSGDAESVGKLLNNLYAVNFTSNPITPGLARCLFFDLASTHLKLINVTRARLGEQVDGQFEAITTILACATAEEMHVQMKQMFLSLTLSLKADRGCHSDQLLQEMTAFIDNHYADPYMGLNMIAEQFNRTPQYVSTFFKKTSGQNITDYIAQCRIHQAKRLISTKDLTIAQIAQKVGYANDLVLIRVFKKVEGITPGKYRDSC
ncbi:helix-turn-helix domain-containing protein [Paenibacillus sepulcri]|uniref:Helix-turn-helix domain-containing protein n=1 Tax=Paenibacillus sepulcri TaxID=359917 RepID=A0ABS7BVV3_9BACL|nr:helix-turn-helix domain-containing protein [Paenibacillus sepulcri]